MEERYGRVFLPMASVIDLATIACELSAKFQTGFHSDSKDAASKALGVR
jgi:predicted ATP-dependent Lon-type protease